MALERQVAQADLAVRADLGEHLGHVGVDVGVAQRPRHRHAVMAVLDEVQVADPVDVDRGHALAASLRRRDALPARAGTRCEVGRKRRSNSRPRSTVPTIESSGDQLLTEPPLATAPERLDDLLEREDEVDVARLAAQRGGQP